MGTSPRVPSHTRQHRYVNICVDTFSYLIALPKLVFALNSTRDWRMEHASFHYPSFYNFIVNYFEDVESDDEETAERVDELLKWWNR